MSLISLHLELMIQSDEYIRRNLEGSLPRRGMDDGSVCVIIPSVGNAEELQIVLQGLTNQDFNGSLEIVVVGPENDLGKEVTESMNCRFIDDGGVRTRADACNVAIEKTQSEFVFFTDDDVIVPNNWISSLIRWFERTDVAGVGGPNFAPPEQSTFW